MSPKPAIDNNKKQKSTGPRTAAGKAASSQNALRHGLASATLLIPGEDPAELAALERELAAEYKPATATETLLVANMVKHQWLMDRAIRLQGEALAIAQPGELPATFPVLLRYQTSNERAFYKALTTLLALQKDNRVYQAQFVSQQAHDEILRELYAPVPESAFEPIRAHMEKLRQQGSL